LNPFVPEDRRAPSRVVGDLQLPTMERPDAVNAALTEWMTA
jgi:hypothetical protein